LTSLFLSHYQLTANLNIKPNQVRQTNTIFNLLNSDKSKTSTMSYLLSFLYDVLRIDSDKYNYCLGKANNFARYLIDDSHRNRISRIIQINKSI